MAAKTLRKAVIDSKVRKLFALMRRLRKRFFPTTEEMLDSLARIGEPPPPFEIVENALTVEELRKMRDVWFKKHGGLESARHLNILTDNDLIQIREDMLKEFKDGPKPPEEKL